MEKNDYGIYMSSNTYATIIMDFMSAIRKVPLNKFSCIRYALECMWNMVTKVANDNQINVVLVSCMEN